MSKQSTNHLFMIEPAVFYANPETMDTNVYQVETSSRTHSELLTLALKEFRTYRDKLIEHGVIITTALGHPKCPDMVFPNWMSMHREDGEPAKLFLYPMLNKNRQAERTPEIIDMFQRLYPLTEDWSHYESQGLALESTASLCMDRVNKICYSTLSARTNKELAEKWNGEMGYKPVIFETHSHTGKPVYHTDYLMFIGTGVAAICMDCINNEYKDTVWNALNSTHEVVELTMEQLQKSCGNALEVIGTNNEKMLTMSESAINALTEKQRAIFAKHYNTIITSPLYTLEKYGGGSARCLLMEMF